MESKSVFVPDNPLMRAHIIPSHPESIFFVGTSGVGKTSLLCWMLDKPFMYKGFYDRIYLFSFSGKCDGMFDNLTEIEDGDVKTKDFEIELTKILDEQQEFIEENGFKASKKTLIILEDITSAPKFLRSAIFTRAYTMNRHLNVSVWSCGHKYKALSAVARLNANHLIIFPTNNDQIEQIAIDYAPPRLSKRDMMELIGSAFEADETHLKPFLFINNKVPFDTKFRKGFDAIIPY